MHGRWCVFGAMCDAGHQAEESMVTQVVEKLNAAGFTCNLSGTTRIRLMLSPALRQLFHEDDCAFATQERVVCAQEKCRGSLVQIVGNATEWMTANRGEGLVVCHRSGREDSVTLAKWKCSAEPQSTSQRLLKEVKVCS